MDYQNFPASELACKCGKCDGGDHMSPDFMRKLVTIRLIFGKVMILSSAYRCPAYNLQVAESGPNGPHTTGRAVDVRVLGSDGLELLRIAVDQGMTGFGISQKGPGATRFIHLDDLGMMPEQPRPWLWSY